jgi:hypothetical protein
MYLSYVLLIMRVCIVGQGDDEPPNQKSRTDADDAVGQKLRCEKSNSMHGALPQEQHLLSCIEYLVPYTRKQVYQNKRGRQAPALLCCARLKRHSACGKWRLGVCSLDERRRTSHPRSDSGLATCYGRRQSVETPDLDVERCRLSHRRPTAHVQRRLRSSLPGNAYARAHRI